MTRRAGNLLVLVGTLVILSVGLAGCGADNSQPAARQPDTTSTASPGTATTESPTSSTELPGLSSPGRSPMKTWATIESTNVFIHVYETFGCFDLVDLRDI